MTLKILLDKKDWISRVELVATLLFAKSSESSDISLDNTN